MEKDVLKGEKKWKIWYFITKGDWNEISYFIWKMKEALHVNEKLHWSSRFLKGDWCEKLFYMENEMKIQSLRGD